MIEWGLLTTKRFWIRILKSLLDYFVIAFFTTIASIILLISLLTNNDNPINWTVFYNNGNIFLYSISLFSSSLVYLLHNRKNYTFGLVLVMIFIIICGLTYSNFLDGLRHETKYIFYSSVFFIIASSMSFFITQFLQHRSVIDVKQTDIDNQHIITTGITFN